MQLTTSSPAGSPYLLLLKPFTSTVSVVLYLCGIAVGLTTGVIVGFGETMLSPVRALRHRTEGQEKLARGAQQLQVPDIDNAMPGMPNFGGKDKNGLDTVQEDEMQHEESGGEDRPVDQLEKKLEEARSLRDRLTVLLAT